MELMPFDADTFEERAAIMEFCGGLTRFNAETQAARLQGIERWQALKLSKETTDANGSRHSVRGQDPNATVAGQSRQDDLSRVQRQPKEENRSMPECKQDAGRDRGPLSSLRMVSRMEVQR